LLDATPTLQDLVKLLDGGAEGVRKQLILDPQALDRLLENSRLPLQYRVSTDDNLFLEYSTPKGNALGSNAARENLDRIVRMSTP
jgi:spermidine synthase